MRLTVKTSASKLREATRTSSGSSSKTGAAVPVKDPFIGGKIIEGKRARNVKKSYVMESDSDEDVEMDMDDEDEDAEGELDEDAEDDGLGDEDADGDIDMDLDLPPPPPPVIKVSKVSSGKQSIIIKPPPKTDNKTVEQKEMENGSEDEELSDLSSALGDDVEEEEGMQSGNDEDAEGEDEDAEGEEIDEEEPLDSDDEETPGGGSRGSTPDLSKLTKRQRARFDDTESGFLMALPDGKLPNITDCTI